MTSLKRGFLYLPVDYHYRIMEMYVTLKNSGSSAASRTKTHEIKLRMKRYGKVELPMDKFEDQPTSVTVSATKSKKWSQHPRKTI